MLESISRIHILLQFETVKFSPHSISMILAQKFANLSLKIMKHREKFIHVFHSRQKWWNKKSQSRSIHVNFHHDPSQITISTSKKHRLHITFLLLNWFHGIFHPRAHPSVGGSAGVWPLSPCTKASKEKSKMAAGYCGRVGGCSVWKKVDP